MMFDSILTTLQLEKVFFLTKFFIDKKTFSFQTINSSKWKWILNFLTKGSQSLEYYDEFKKVQILDDGLMVVLERDCIETQAFNGYNCK